jgi:glycosyltransferase involved in cell wall biosynthesis
LSGWLLGAFLQYYRKWDTRVVRGIDHFVAISNWVAQKVDRAYQRSADVIYPPVDVSSFSSGSDKNNYYLTISRLVPYKRVDVIVESFSRMPDKKLIIIGEGPSKLNLAQSAADNIKFLGYQPFDVMKSYLEGAKGFVYSAVEDFGISPIEAQAAGTPVIGLRKGGLMETVIDGETGVFYDSQTPESLVATINDFESSKIEFNPDHMHKQATKFSKERFQSEISAYVNQRWLEFTG